MPVKQTMKKEEIKTAVLSFLVPLAGLYVMYANRYKDAELSRFAGKWTLNGLATSAAAAIFAWMYHTSR